MKRRAFISRVAGSAVVGATGIAPAKEAGTTRETAPLVRTPAVVMAPRMDGVEIVWAVSKLARGRVEWKCADGTTGAAAADRFGFVPQGDEVLHVRIDGLKPGMNHEFRAITEATEDKDRHEGEWRKFRTLDPEAKSTSFVVWNDTHENAETIQRLHACTPAGDFLLWNGDTCNNWYQEEWLVPTLLHPAGQDFTAERPLLLVWGNHDVRGEWAFKMPEMVATPDGRPYYAFRSGPVAFICLHTGEDKPDNHPSFGGRVAFEQLRRDQADWLKETIARPEFRDAPYRVVFCHIPLRWKEERHVAPSDYGNGSYDAFSRFSRELWHDSLVAWKTQVVVSGHTHSAAWLPATKDFPYAQLVGGGPLPAAATWIEGMADAKALTFVMKNLDGKVIEKVGFAPLV